MQQRCKMANPLARWEGSEDGGLAKLAGALHTEEQTKKHMATFTKGLSIKYGENLNKTIIMQEQDVHARGLYRYVKERPDVEKALKKYFI